MSAAEQHVTGALQELKKRAKHCCNHLRARLPPGSGNFSKYTAITFHVCISFCEIIDYMAFSLAGGVGCLVPGA